MCVLYVNRKMLHTIDSTRRRRRRRRRSRQRWCAHFADFSRRLYICILYIFLQRCTHKWQRWWWGVLFCGVGHRTGITWRVSAAHRRRMGAKWVVVVVVVSVESRLVRTCANIHRMDVVCAAGLYLYKAHHALCFRKAPFRPFHPYTQNASHTHSRRRRRRREPVDTRGRRRCRCRSSSKPADDVLVWCGRWFVLCVMVRIFDAFEERCRRRRSIA